jgi:ABC-type polysaccharide/polyol phosphate transport system ATPase subunit
MANPGSGQLRPASVRARGLGVHFIIDRQKKVVTPAHARLLRRGTDVWGLREVTFRADPGDGIALIGVNGSGKTTLLRAIAGVLPADAGAIEVEGQIGSMLSTDAGLLPTLTGRENALLLAVLAGLSRAQAKAALPRIQQRSGLGSAFDRPANSFSQGMRARLAFTTADEADPNIFLLDEVHEAFDRPFQKVLERRVRDLRAAGGIVVAAGHDLDILSRICDRAALLDGGRVVAEGPIAQVRDEYMATEVAAS